MDRRIAEARKNKGVTIKTEYDGEGKAVRSSRADAPPSDSNVSSRSMRDRLKGVGAKMSKALAKKEMTEAEIDAAIRITNKKATLAKARGKLHAARSERVNAALGSFGSFMGGPTNPTRGKKNNGGGGSGYDYFGMQDAGKSSINNNFSFYDWTYGGPRKQVKSGNDILKDYYGM